MYYLNIQCVIGSDPLLFATELWIHFLVITSGNTWYCSWCKHL